MLDHLKRHSSLIPLYLVVAIVALIGWPYTLAFGCCIGVVVLMDEVLHAPRWATTIVVNIMFIAALFLLSYWTGLDLSTSGETPACSHVGC